MMKLLILIKQLKQKKLVNKGKLEIIQIKNY